MAATTSKGDTTFRAYNKQESATYEQLRPAYHASLEKLIIDHHTSTGGQLDTLVDVGCGPGIATRQFARHFNNVTGLDHSPGMLEKARASGGVTATDKPIRYELSTAESLGSELDEAPIASGSVDMISAATAAHFFDMPRFWPRAAQILRPGGTVAFWTGQSAGVHPDTPNAVAINALIDEFENTHFKPYVHVSNMLTKNFYDDLVLPWALPQPCEEFDKATFLRKEWNRGPGSEDGETFFVFTQPAVDMPTMEMAMSTMSTVNRWRQAHPDAVNTENDVARMLRRGIEKLLREAGVDDQNLSIRFGIQGVLLMVKRK